MTGRRGRPPKPAVLLQLEGTYRKDRHEERQERRTGPRAPLLKRPPKPPEHLSKEAKSYVRDLAGRAIQLGVLTRPDLGTLMMAGDLYDAYLTAREAVAERGPTIDTAAGNPKANPAVGQMLQLADRLMRIENGFGLSPTARASAQTAPQEAEKSNPWAQFPSPPRLFPT